MAPTTASPSPAMLNPQFRDAAPGNGWMVVVDDGAVPTVTELAIIEEAVTRREDGLVG